MASGSTTGREGTVAELLRRISPGSTSEARGRPKLKVFPLFLAIVVLASVFWSLSPLKQRLEQGREIFRLKKEIAVTRLEKLRLYEEIKKLKTDKFYIEEIARKKLGLIKPDEEAYVVVDKKSPALKKPAAKNGLWVQVKNFFKRLFTKPRKD